MPYKAILSGSCNNVRFNVGDTVYQPKGSMDGCKSLIWIGEEQEPESETILPDSQKPLDGTVKEIKAFLDENGVEYKSNARKDELLEILDNV